jgi:hypothetical protein
MSAFVISHDHADLMVSAAWALLDNAERDNLEPDEYGRELLEENLRAITYRYPGVLEGDPVPGVIGETPATYRYRPVRLDLDELETLAQILKACRCWFYQTSEAPDHRQAPAWDLVERLFSAALYRLPGMDEAAWEWFRRRGRSMSAGRFRGGQYAEHRFTVNALRGVLLEKIGPGEWWSRPRVVLVDTLDQARASEPKPAPRHMAGPRGEAAANRAAARARDIEAGIIRGADLIDGIGREFREAQR